MSVTKTGTTKNDCRTFVIVVVEEYSESSNNTHTRRTSADVSKKLSKAFLN
jgi:hypothetical protein